MILSLRSCATITLLLFTLLSSSHCLSLPDSAASGVYSALDQDQNHDSGSTTFQGWTPSPNGRGTIDIIWSCVFTIFLCCWSVLCLNIPAETDSFWRIIWRKFCLTGLGIVGPEFILQSALGQWISARRSVKAFRKSGYHNWTMNHAFFADMGGFVLHTPDWVPFPIDAKQVHYLVTNSYLSYPTITKPEIQDRNKVDALLRVITVLQTLWFVVNCMARRIQKLEVTTFELTTAGFIFCTFGTYICWGHKPADVEIPLKLYCNTPLKEILLDAGDIAKSPYSRTPLDFLSRKEWSWSLWWSCSYGILEKVFHIRYRQTVRPITRFPNDSWPEIPPVGIFLLDIVDMVYASIYMLGWNFYFPTKIERTLWRTSTTTILGVVASYLIIEAYTYYLLPALPKRFRKMFEHDPTPRSRTWLHNTVPGKVHQALDWMRNNSTNRDPLLYMPLKASIPITIAGAVYSIARAYILIECLVVLRKLPSSTYETVNWSSFVPHI